MVSSLAKKRLPAVGVLIDRARVRQLRKLVKRMLRPSGDQLGDSLSRGPLVKRRAELPSTLAT